MRFQFNPGKQLWNGAASGIGAIGIATSAILKSFMKSGYGPYITGRKILTDANETVEDIAAEPRAEIEAEKSAHRPGRPEHEPSRPGEAGKEEASREGIKPRTAAPASGRYQEIGSRGGKGCEIVSEKGRRYRPLPRKAAHTPWSRPAMMNRGQVTRRRLQ